MEESLVKLLFSVIKELQVDEKCLKIKALQNPQAVATRVPFGVLSLTLCDPLDCSPPCSSVHWVLQARILEWVAISTNAHQRGTDYSTGFY